MNKNTAAVELGRKGGKAKSAAKTLAARRNAQLPRPGRKANNKTAARRNISSAKKNESRTKNPGMG